MVSLIELAEAQNSETVWCWQSLVNLYRMGAQTASSANQLAWSLSGDLNQILYLQIIGRLPVSLDLFGSVDLCRSGTYLVHVVKSTADKKTTSINKLR